MRIATRTFALLCAFAVPAIAHADTIVSFSFYSGLTMGYTAQGKVNIDTTTGVVETSNFSVSQGGVVDAVFTTTSSTELYNNDYLAMFNGSVAGYTYELLFPVTSLVGYTGGSLCTNSAPCAGVVSGSYTPTGEATANTATLTATPEPSGVALLGTGLFAVVGATRRFRQKV